jgi:hypothetical protein
LDAALGGNRPGDSEADGVHQVTGLACVCRRCRGASEGQPSRSRREHSSRTLSFLEGCGDYTFADIADPYATASKVSEATVTIGCKRDIPSAGVAHGSIGTAESIRLRRLSKGS